MRDEYIIERNDFLKKKVLIFTSLLLILIIVLGGKYLKHIQQEIETNQKTIEQLKVEKEKSIESFKQLEEEKTKLETKLKKQEEKMNSTEIQNQQLEQQLQDMLKNVSLNAQDVSQPSGATVYHMKKALKGTTMYHLANAFVEAENTYGVNAFFLAGIVALESSWATSPRAIDGSNNLTGHGVFTNASRGSQFSSHDESVMITARDISRDYLTSEGEFYNGKSIAGVNIKYSASTDWKDNVAQIGFDLLYEANH